MRAAAKARTGRGGEGAERLCDLALILAIGLVLCRCLMLESVRDVFTVQPGQDIVLRSPSASVSVILDCLSFLPAILVCIRGIRDRRFAVSMLWSSAILGVIGVLAVLSAFWSADRYVAAVSAGKLISGAALAWAVAQCVRDWRAFRLICGILAGLLAVFVVHTAIYLYSDLPQTQKFMEENREQTLKEQGFTEGSFLAAQFERKLTSGEVMGFCASPNSFAAMTVLIVMCMIGDAGQKLASRQPAGALIVPLMLLAGAGWIILRTQSNTAVVTSVLGMGPLAALWMLRNWIGKRRKLVFAGAMVCILIGIAAVVGHGLHYGNLVQRSLTFRWQYWQASFAMFMEHPWLGVGWENFGLHYLQYRLPVAPEEIKDPHNLFVRFATELGFTGLVLALAWVVTTAWGASRPMTLEDTEKAQQRGIGRVLGSVSVGIVLSIIFSLDWTQDIGVLQLDVLRKAMYGVIMIGVAIAFGATDLKTLREDGSPAPLLAMAMGVGLMLFLLHNMIDFAFSETGGFYLSMLCIGAVLGLRVPQPASSAGGSAALIGAVVVVLAFALGGAVGVPVLASEGSARAGDLAIARRQFATAAGAYARAFEESGWLRNADDLSRQASALAWAGRDPAAIVEVSRGAIQANPRLINAYMAVAEASVRLRDRGALTDAIENATKLNPTSVALRVDVGGMLAAAGLKLEAAQQYREALRLNGLLPPDEPKRLSAERESDIRNRLSALQS